MNHLDEICSVQAVNFPGKGFEAKYLPLNGIEAANGDQQSCHNQASKRTLSTDLFQCLFPNSQINVNISNGYPVQDPFKMVIPSTHAAKSEKPPRFSDVCLDIAGKFRMKRAAVFKGSCTPRSKCIIIKRDTV